MLNLYNIISLIDLNNYNLINFPIKNNSNQNKYKNNLKLKKKYKIKYLYHQNIKFNHFKNN